MEVAKDPQRCSVMYLQVILCTQVSISYSQQNITAKIDSIATAMKIIITLCYTLS